MSQVGCIKTEYRNNKNLRNENNNHNDEKHESSKESSTARNKHCSLHRSRMPIPNTKAQEDGSSSGSDAQTAQNGNDQYEGSANSATEHASKIYAQGCIGTSLGIVRTSLQTKHDYVGATMIRRTIAPWDILWLPRNILRPDLGDNELFTLFVDGGELVHEIHDRHVLGMRNDVFNCQEISTSRVVTTAGARTVYDTTTGEVYTKIADTSGISKLCHKQ